MSKTTSVLAATALMVAAAAADDRYETAIRKHEECTRAAATKLANKNGRPDRLARQALRACRAEQARLSKVMQPSELRLMLRSALYVRERTIREARAEREGPARIYCAACGMKPASDELG